MGRGDPPSHGPLSGARTELGSRNPGAPKPCPACGAGPEQSTDPANMLRSVCYCGHPPVLRLPPRGRDRPVYCCVKNSSCVARPSRRRRPALRGARRPGTGVLGMTVMGWRTPEPERPRRRHALDLCRSWCGGRARAMPAGGRQQAAARVGAGAPRSRRLDSKDRGIRRCNTPYRSGLHAPDVQCQPQLEDRQPRPRRRWCRRSALPARPPLMPAHDRWRTSYLPGDGPANGPPGPSPQLTPSHSYQATTTAATIAIHAVMVPSSVADGTAVPNQFAYERWPSTVAGVRPRTAWRRPGSGRLSPSLEGREFTGGMPGTAVRGWCDAARSCPLVTVSGSGYWPVDGPSIRGR